MPLKIGVLYGGRSAERDVSLRSGEAIFQALTTKEYNAVKIDVAKNDFIESIKDENIDLAFLALHGKYGEDGTIQGLLELLNIPYTGSGVLASAIAMDKISTKKILIHDNIPTPEFCTYDQASIKNTGIDNICSEIIDKLSLPVVVKAPTQGSTIGISFVNDITQLPAAIEESLRYDDIVLIEKKISGAEVTVTVIGNDNDNLRVLPQIEIVSATGVYDYHAKYTVGMSDHIIPPRLPSTFLEKTSELALRTYRAIGCSGLVRVDFIVNPKGEPYVLEINTLPGMTETSLVPDAARAAGIEFPELTHMLVDLALDRHSAKK